MENCPADQFIYETEDAVAFVTKETGIDEDKVRLVHSAHCALEDVLGLTSEPNPDVDVAALRAKYRDLIPQSTIHRRSMSYDLEATFVQGETGLPMQVVFDVLASDTAYMAKLGIVDPDAVDAYRQWAWRRAASCRGPVDSWAETKKRSVL